MFPVMLGEALVMRMPPALPLRTVNPRSAVARVSACSKVTTGPFPAPSMTVATGPSELRTSIRRPWKLRFSR